MYGSVFVPLINAIKSFFPILLINEVLFKVKKNNAGTIFKRFLFGSYCLLFIC